MFIDIINNRYVKMIIIHLYVTHQQRVAEHRALHHIDEAVLLHFEQDRIHPETISS